MSTEEIQPIQRYFHVDDATIVGLQSNSGAKYVGRREMWTEKFFDTPCSSLSNAECILKTDSTAPQYWKFFCYAEDNILETTTDEKDIREPLSRMMNFHSNATDIKTKSIKSFFEINNVADLYIIDDCEVKVSMTDYGFGYCWVQVPNKGGIVDMLDKLDEIVKALALRPLTSYEPLNYL